MKIPTMTVICKFSDNQDIAFYDYYRVLPLYPIDSTKF